MEGEQIHDVVDDLHREYTDVEVEVAFDITSLGKATLIHQDQYRQVDDFGAFIQGPKTTPGDTTPQASFARGDDQS